MFTKGHPLNGGKPSVWAVSYTYRGTPHTRECLTPGSARRTAQELERTGADNITTSVEFESRADEAAFYARRPYHPEALFVDELDGLTFRSREELSDYRDSQKEIDAENGWLRMAENNYFTPQEGGY